MQKIPEKMYFVCMYFVVVHRQAFMVLEATLSHCIFGHGQQEQLLVLSVKDANLALAPMRNQLKTAATTDERCETDDIY